MNAAILRACFILAMMGGTLANPPPLDSRGCPLHGWLVSPQDMQDAIGMLNDNLHEITIQIGGMYDREVSLSTIQPNDMCFRMTATWVSPQQRDDNFLTSNTLSGQALTSIMCDLNADEPGCIHTDQFNRCLVDLPSHLSGPSQVIGGIAGTVNGVMYVVQAHRPASSGCRG